MTNQQFVMSASMDIEGITPTSGPRPQISGKSSYTTGGVLIDDSYTETFVVNPSTPLTALNIGEIVTGVALWIQVSAPMPVTLTQDLGSGPVDITTPVDKFYFAQTTFTAVKLANPSVAAITVSISVVGNRIPLGVGPGIF